MVQRGERGLKDAEALVDADDLDAAWEAFDRADSVLVEAEPLEDIKNTQTIWRVIKGGFVFDPEELRPSSN